MMPAWRLRRKHPDPRHEDHLRAVLEAHARNAVPDALVAEILEGIAEAERGETVTLGSFAAYCEDDGEPEEPC